MTTEVSNNSKEINTTKPEESDSWVDLSLRCAKVALPFLTLFKPLYFPVAVTMTALYMADTVMNLTEAINEGNPEKICFAAIETTIAVVVFAATIFSHPIGQVIFTLYSMANQFVLLYEQLRDGKILEALETVIQIINGALFLCFFYFGGIELSIASLVLQISLGVWTSFSEYKKGHLIEGSAYLMWTAIGMSQLKKQATHLALQSKIKKIFQSTAKDSLPLSAKINKAKVVTWDVSGISSDKKIAQCVSFMIHERPSLILSLQGCRPELLQALNKQGMKHMKLARVSQNGKEALFYDKRRFKLKHSSDDRVLFKSLKTKQKYQIVSAKSEDLLHSTSPQKKITTIVLGKVSLTQQAQLESYSFKNLTAYNTTTGDTTNEQIWTNGAKTAKVNPNDLIEGLESAVRKTTAKFEPVKEESFLQFWLRTLKTWETPKTSALYSAKRWTIEEENIKKMFA